ncbi:MAG TPA: hypothetical protein VNT02_13470 [Burkholderiales bacterium]|nr:hypothetical protein [Burkholderiales bacterium]
MPAAASGDRPNPTLKRFAAEVPREPRPFHGQSIAFVYRTGLKSPEI